MCYQRPYHDRLPVDRAEAVLVELARRAGGTNDTGSAPLRVQAPATYHPWLQGHLRRLPTELAPAFATGIIVVPAADPPEQLVAADQLQHPQPADLVLLPPDGLADLVHRGAAADLGWLAEADRELAWWDVLQPYRDSLALYDSTHRALPVGAGPVLLFARVDVLTAVRERVPETWQQLLELARRYGSLRRPGDPPHALCLPAGPDCSRLHVLDALWASVAQTRGRQQGLHFNPWDGRPRLDTAALRYSLQLLANLSAMAAPEGSAGTGAGDDADGAAGSGACGGWGGDASSGGIASRGFTAGACALAIAGVAQVQPQSGPTAASATGPLMVNRSPQLSAAALTGAINSSAAPLSQLRAYLLLRHLAGAGPDEPCAGARASGLLPVRVSCLAAGAQDAAVAAGFLPAQDTAGSGVESGGSGSSGVGGSGGDSGGAVRRSLEGLARDVVRLSGREAEHTNAGWTVSVPGSWILRQELYQLLQAASACAAPASSSATADSSGACWGDLWAQLRSAQERVAAAFPPGLFLPAYRVGLGLSRTGALPSHGGDVGRAGGEVKAGGAPRAGLTAVAVCLPLCVVALAVALAMLRQRRRLTLLGHALSAVLPRRRRWESRAPGPSPDTCLVVTDIQDSTALWEALPASVMDASVDLHHSTVRRLLLMHAGYESATEGDSFILAFSRPGDALGFSLELQVALLFVEWPQRLLAEPVCAPVWTSLPPGFPFVGRATAPHSHHVRHPATPTVGARPTESGAAAGGSGGGLTADYVVRLAAAAAAAMAAAAPVGGRAGSRVLPPSGRATPDADSTDAFLDGGDLYSSDGGRPTASSIGQSSVTNVMLAAATSTSTFLSVGHAGSPAAGRRFLPDVATPSPRRRDTAGSGGSGTATVDTVGAGAGGTAACADGFGVGGSGGPAPHSPAMSWTSDRRYPASPPLRLSNGGERSRLRAVLRGRYSLDLSASRHGDGATTIRSIPELSSRMALHLVSDADADADLGGVTDKGSAAPEAAAGDAVDPGFSGGDSVGVGGNFVSGMEPIPARPQPLRLGEWLQAEAAAITGPGPGPGPGPGLGPVASGGVEGSPWGVIPCILMARPRSDRLPSAGPAVRSVRSFASGGSGIISRGNTGVASSMSCVFRGLRVRVGVSVGPASGAEVAHNAASQRTVYCGPAASAAKLVSDAAHGGMVTVAGAVQARLTGAAAGNGHGGGNARDWPRGAKLPPHVMLRVGRFRQSHSEQDLYLAWPEQLTQRLALLPPPRCMPLAVAPSVYEAPVREAALATLHVPHLSALRAWDEAAARGGLGCLAEVACRQALAQRGYLASIPHPSDATAPSWGAGDAGSTFVAAFGSAADAVRWALSVMDALTEADWPPALMTHELCQPAVLPLLGAPVPEPGQLQTAPSLARPSQALQALQRL
ncbi:hypothetical protein GPECTOR_1g793 [Gonium pectorale]|uniref:Guanylate cyclase domain-containing protein n=1 Tax=Gonium pectorale TaxID=33097 RepID=A0A150H409_GONPE|nr:hypothetical protein GPECTOR_1g793 [Gonium pectorale]|eukprot:KXZ56879.1 hypothetical protein GPECTOR_1g793 [Gonium pectorale]